MKQLQTFMSSVKQLVFQKTISEPQLQYCVSAHYGAGDTKGCVELELSLSEMPPFPLQLTHLIWRNTYLNWSIQNCSIYNLSK